MWQLISSLENLNQPWLCVGDFNEIIYLHEKQGGRLREFEKMNALCSTMDVYGLWDLVYRGNPSNLNYENNKDQIKNGRMSCNFYIKWKKL